MNPALIDAGSDETSGSTAARLGYAFLPYGRLQQGRSPAPNPNDLAIDLHLATLQLSISAPAKTRLDLQPLARRDGFLSMIHRTVAHSAANDVAHGA